MVRTVATSRRYYVFHQYWRLARYCSPGRFGNNITAFAFIYFNIYAITGALLRTIRVLNTNEQANDTVGTVSNVLVGNPSLEAGP